MRRPRQARQAALDQPTSGLSPSGAPTSSRRTPALSARLSAAAKQGRPPTLRAPRSSPKARPAVPALPGQTRASRTADLRPAMDDNQSSWRAEQMAALPRRGASRCTRRGRRVGLTTAPRGEAAAALESPRACSDAHAGPQQAGRMAPRAIEATVVERGTALLLPPSMNEGQLSSPSPDVVRVLTTSHCDMPGGRLVCQARKQAHWSEQPCSSRLTQQDPSGSCCHGARAGG